MALFLFRFYPVLFPLSVYWIWLRFARRRARIKGEALPRFRDGPIFLLLISSLLIGIFCLVVLGFSIADSGHKVDYQPPRMEGKKLISSQVKP
jgi:hypothetical protein